MPNYGGYAGKNSGSGNYGGRKGGNSGPRGGGSNNNSGHGFSGSAPKSIVIGMALLLGIPFLLFLASLGYAVLS